MSKLTIRAVDNLNGEVFGDQAVTGEILGFDAGFNFRNTSGYVTDGANQTYVLVADTYPTNRGGFTFGWETTDNLEGRDRSTGVDVRLAGVNFRTNTVNTNTATFRADLTATGNYVLRMALGDAAVGNAARNYVVVKDNTTALITFAPIATSTTEWADAAGSLWSTANWPGSNVSSNQTFASTILRVTLGGTIDTDASSIAHLSILSA